MSLLSDAGRQLRWSEFESWGIALSPWAMNNLENELGDCRFWYSWHPELSLGDVERVDPVLAGPEIVRILRMLDDAAYVAA